MPQVLMEPESVEEIGEPEEPLQFMEEMWKPPQEWLEPELVEESMAREEPLRSGEET